MCVVKTKEHVVSGEDLHDLITSRISVKCSPFTVEEILFETQALLTGSRYEKDDIKIMHVIKKIICILINNDYIVKEMNKYRTSA